MHFAIQQVETKQFVDNDGRLTSNVLEAKKYRNKGQAERHLPKLNRTHIGQEIPFSVVHIKRKGE